MPVDSGPVVFDPGSGYIVLRVPNMMKRAMRCHDFGSGREASRSQYREYW
jgi:hypothetical protein